MKKTKTEQELILAYQSLYQLTNPECAKCRVPHSCCAPIHCEITKKFAKEKWGVDLKATDHPTLPYMGNKGCIVEPHFRPHCTLHTCAVNAFGRKEHDEKWNDEYWNLRDAVDHKEWEREEEQERQDKTKTKTKTRGKDEKENTKETKLHL